MPHHLVEHLVGEADPQVLGLVDAHNLGLRHCGETLAGLLGLEVVVELRDDRDQGLAGGGPGFEVLRPGVPQGWAEQDHADDAGVHAVHQGQVGAEAPAEQPRRRQVQGLDQVQGCGDVVVLVDSVAESALAGPLRAGGAAGVEAEHGDVREGWQPVGELLQDVAVHHPAVRRQRMQTHDGRDRRAVHGQGQLADQPQSVGGLQGDQPTFRGKHGVGADLRHRRGP